MHISRQEIKLLCKNKEIKLKDLLEQAHISKTAFYSILNKESVLPRSIHSIASALGVKPSAFLEEESPDEKDARKLIDTVDAILKSNSGLDRENVRHTLLLLQEKPIERLRRGLIRAQKFDFHR